MPCSLNIRHKSWNRSPSDCLLIADISGEAGTQLGRKEAMAILGYIDSPISWAIVGFVIGVALGVNFASVILVAVGLGAFVLYMFLHGPAKQETEGKLFAACPVFIVAWMVGFAVHSLVL